MKKPSKTLVDDSTLCSVLAGIAAVIEEPYCIVGQDELKQLVHAHNAISRAFGGLLTPDYAFKNGLAVSAHNGRLIKQPVSSPENPLLGKRTSR